MVQKPNMCRMSESPMPWPFWPLGFTSSFSICVKLASLSDTCDISKESTEGAPSPSPELPRGLYDSLVKHTGTMIRELNEELRRAEGKAKPRYDYLAMLFVYTASRCVANALLVDPKIMYAYDKVMYVDDVQRPERPHDFWARPIVSGLGLFFFHFSTKSLCPRVTATYFELAHDAVLGGLFVRREYQPRFAPGRGRGSRLHWNNCILFA